MADYFTNFSVVLPLTQEQQDYAVKLFKHASAHQNEGTPPPADFPSDLADETEGWTFEIEATPKGLWLNSQYGGQETACAFIQHLLQKFEFAPFVSFEWSHDCSKPLTDAFGGGAAFITATEIETFSTSEWLSKMSC